MKYMGSKSRIAKYIVPIIQNEIDTHEVDSYYEPFCGGCNILDKIHCKEKYASDINRFLIALLQHTKTMGIKDYPVSVDKIHYAEIRDCFNSVGGDWEAWYIGAIGFLASYNGRFFDGGYAGTVHTKDGTIRDYYAEAKRNLHSQFENFVDIHNTSFHCHDYAERKDCKDLAGMVIYCDIPYQGTKQYSSSKNFDYNRFWDWAREQSRDNIVLVSELNAPDEWECIWSQELLRTVDNAKRVSSVEKLFRYKG
jgi:DNA adenine methylase